MTVRGHVAADQLGVTLAHEHVVIGPIGKDLVESNYFDRRHASDFAVKELRLAGKAGLTTIIDPCPPDLGRDVELLREVSELSGIHIVAATGCYNERLGFPAYFKTLAAEDLTELFVRELNDGVRDTGIRPGIVKIATSGDRIRFHEHKALLAAAATYHRTGVPIFTHTEAGKFGLEQVEALRAEGVPAEKIVVGHTDGVAEIADIVRILDSGVFIGIDRVGGEWHGADARRKDQLQQIVARGYASQVLLGHDFPLLSGWDSDGDFCPPSHIERRQFGLRFMFERFIPQLEDIRQELEAMLTSNVTRLFS